MRRPPGKWHLLFYVISLLAIPLIYSVCLGVAEAARDIALERARSRRDGQDISYLVGETDNELATARFALRDMLDVAATAEPGTHATNRVMTGRAILARSAIHSVEKAMEVAGGAAFYRDLGLEAASVTYKPPLPSTPGKGAASLFGSDGTRADIDE